MIDGYTRTCGLIGCPVEHTLSPVIHNYLAGKLGDNLAYVPFHVQNGCLEAAVKGAWALNLLGCNVTVPYKSDVMPFLAQTDPLAARIGAVNTLVRTAEGFKGYNTDMPGLYRAMVQERVQIAGERVIVLGAGGVARAVAVMLAANGASGVVIVNRTVEKASKIADEVNEMMGRRLAEALALSDYGRLSDGTKYLAIQATSVGMYPNVEEAVIEDAEFYEMIHTGYDLVFNPPETRFMELVKAHGGRSFNGAKMLLYQGIIAYELWTGRQVGEELAAQVYQEMYAAMGL